MKILHITTQAEWQAAQDKGAYTADTLESEGYIHCSRPEQVEKVANTFYLGQSHLILLNIDPALLHSELRWEAADGDQFPHIYGPLNLEAVTSVEDFPSGEGGRFHYEA